MLRLCVLTLLLANLVYYAWGAGWLAAYGWSPVSQREPQRLSQQINPDAVTVLADNATAATSATGTPPALVCLQSTLLEAEQAAALRPLLQAQLGSEQWQLQEQLPPPHWLIYMGKFTNTAELDSKRSQLTQLKVKFEPIELPELSPGLALGHFPTQEAAQTALQLLAKRGVRTAKMVQVQEQSPRYQLRLPAVDPAQVNVQAVVAAVPGQPLQPCSAPSGSTP